MYGHRLTIGKLRRHLPPDSSVPFDIAMLDVAQDFLLTALSNAGVLNELVFKGGTAVRKCLAGPAGRFSTDIDFGTASPVPRSDFETYGNLVVEALTSAVGPFIFKGTVRRGRWMLRTGGDFGEIPIDMKIDIGPFPWMQSVNRHFVPTPTHESYDFPLPTIPTIAIEELLAEKIARLNRRSTARDAFDLVWLASTSPHSTVERDQVRRLAILKTLADTYGLGATLAVSDAVPLDPHHWLRVREDWDDEAIGLLTTPAPRLDDLGEDLREMYSWLSDLTPSDRQLMELSEPQAVVTAICDTEGVVRQSDDFWIR